MTGRPLPPNIEALVSGAIPIAPETYDSTRQTGHISPPSGPEGKPTGSTSRRSLPAAANLESAAASTYGMRGIQWLWPNRFALGKLGLISGMPDRGKGLIVSNMIATVTKGGEWPCGEGTSIRGNVLLLTAEDDIEDTIIPRLVAAGADCDCVHIVKMVREGKRRRMFSLATDLLQLRQKIDEVGGVVLIVIDPMSAYQGVGKVDSYRTTDVRAMLAPLVELVSEKKVAIVGIMHFNKKDDVKSAMLRTADSLAYVALARHCYIVVDDEANQRRLFVAAKNNLAPDRAALSYTVKTTTVGSDPDTHDMIVAPYVEWGAEHVEISASEAMQAENSNGDSGAARTSAREEAKTFLQEILATSPKPQEEILDAAKADMISVPTLKRAKADLGIRSKKHRQTGKWWWGLPQQTFDFDH